MKNWLVTLLWVGLAVVYILPCTCGDPVTLEDNDFAEFDTFDDENVWTETHHDEKPEETKASDKLTEENQPPPQILKEKPIEEPEFDKDMFEEFDSDATVSDTDDDDVFEIPDATKKVEKIETLKMVNIPKPKTPWQTMEAFIVEIMMVLVLIIYVINYLVGRNKNIHLANAWLDVHKDILEANFSLVGDDGQDNSDGQGQDVLIKEADHIFNFWCSGRVCCEGMLIELKFLKRQDLIHVVCQKFSPQTDKVILKVHMDDNDMDSFILALGNKKACAVLQKEMYDLDYYVSEKKRGELFGLPPGYQVLCECHEAAEALLDVHIKKMLHQYEHLIEFIHFSDQYGGIKAVNAVAPTSGDRPYESKKALVFCFNLPGKGNTNVADMEMMKPMLRMVMYCIDKVGRFRLSREGRSRVEKSRQKALEGFLKQQHAQRQEAAQQRRDEKRRTEKERLMAEEDPDKQRKLEVRQEKKDKKRSNGKVKMMKIKF